MFVRLPLCCTIWAKQSTRRLRDHTRLLVVRLRAASGSHLRLFMQWSLIMQLIRSHRRLRRRLCRLLMLSRLLVLVPDVKRLICISNVWKHWKVSQTRLQASRSRSQFRPDVRFVLSSDQKRSTNSPPIDLQAKSLTRSRKV